MWLWLLLPAALVAAPVAAQDSALPSRLEPVLTAAPGTPGGASLIDTALAEARIAVQEAVGAAEATDLATARARAQGVRHAVDPALEPRGPGLGYGVRPAVVAIAQQIEALAAEDGAADVAAAVPQARRAAVNVQAWSDALVAAADRVVRAGSLGEAAAAADAMTRLAAQLTAGIAPDGVREVATTPEAAGLLGLRLRLRVLSVRREAAVAVRSEATR